MEDKLKHLLQRARPYLNKLRKGDHELTELLREIDLWTAPECCCADDGKENEDGA